MSCESDDEFIPKQVKEDIINKSISALPDISPVKVTQIGSRDRIGYAKRKFKEITDMSQQLLEDCTGVASNIEAGSSQQKQDKATKAEADIEFLVKGLKEKMLTSNRQQQLSLLTLAPNSWTIEKASTEFNVTKYTVRKAWKLCKEQGILPTVTSAQGKPVNEEMVRLVKEFYYEDDVSRVMPGAKDFVSVREGDKSVHKQRRLLLQYST